MAMRVTVCDLRNDIDSIYRDIRSRSGTGEASNQEILHEIKKRKSDVISLLTPKLVEMQLTKLLNDVSGRRIRRSLVVQGADLFQPYLKLPASIPIGRGKKKALPMLTYGEAVHYRDKRRANASRRPPDSLERLLTDCQPFRQFDDDTLQMLLERKEAAQRR